MKLTGVLVSTPALGDGSHMDDAREPSGPRSDAGARPQSRPTPRFRPVPRICLLVFVGALWILPAWFVLALTGAAGNRDGLSFAAWLYAPVVGLAWVIWRNGPHRTAMSFLAASAVLAAAAATAALAMPSHDRVHAAAGQPPGARKGPLPRR